MPPRPVWTKSERIGLGSRGGSAAWRKGVAKSEPFEPFLTTLLEQAKANATRPVSIRLSVSDIELAKNIASKRGTGYQTVLKEAIRYGLKRAG